MKTTDIAKAVSQVDPEKEYPVSYSIDHSGEKHLGDTMLKGKDLTENQIIEVTRKGFNERPERMLKWFEHELGELPDEITGVTNVFHKCAETLCSILTPGPERTVALRKLLEAKDAAVRARLSPGG